MIKFEGALTLLLMVIVSFTLCCNAFADTGNDDRVKQLQESLKTLETQISELKTELDQLKSQQNTDPPPTEPQQQHIDKMVEKAFEKQKKAAPQFYDWFERIKFSGDFRYRHESINRQTERDFLKGNNRHRIRARLGLSAEIDDQWDVYFRIATGSEIPTSTNQTLTDSFSTKDFLLDRAYFDWHPDSSDGLNVYGGKMRNPFYMPLRTELMWDGDLNPEGLAANWVIPLNTFDQFHLNGGGLWVDKNFPNQDIFLWGIQGILAHQFPGDNYFRGGMTYYNYTNIQCSPSLQSFFSDDVFFLGNTSVDGKYATDFDLIELFAEHGFYLASMPVSILYDYINNVAAKSGDNIAWLAGCTINKANKAGSWQIWYNYRDLDPDSVVAVFTDLDPGGGGTNIKGHELGMDYRLTDDITTSIYYYQNIIAPDDQDYNKIQADLMFKF